MTSSSRNQTDQSSRHSQSYSQSTAPASSLSLKSVVLHDWWLRKADGNRISVAGRESGKKGNRAFFFAPISRRIDTTTLQTIDGITITISGVINRSKTHQNGIPFPVCNKFQLGFPYHWEECVAQFYGEESPKQDVPNRKSGFAEHNKCSGTNAMPSNLDDLSAIRLREFVMRLPGDSEDCICCILGKFLGNTSQHTPGAPHSNFENVRPSATANDEVNENIRNDKAKNDEMHEDDNDRIGGAKGTEKEEMTPSKGVATRSMCRSRNLRSKQEDNLLAPHSNFENVRPSTTANDEVNENIRNDKAKTDEMHEDDNNGIGGAKGTEKEEITPSKGVATRSMCRSRNLRSKQEDNLVPNSSFEGRNFRKELKRKVSSNVSIESDISSPLSTSVANKSLSVSVSNAMKASSKAISSRQDKEIAETPNTSKLRSSGRLKIRKNYRGMAR